MSSLVFNCYSLRLFCVISGASLSLSRVGLLYPKSSTAAYLGGSVLFQAFICSSMGWLCVTPSVPWLLTRVVDSVLSMFSQFCLSGLLCFFLCVTLLLTGVVLHHHMYLRVIQWCGSACPQVSHCCLVWWLYVVPGFLLHLKDFSWCNFRSPITTHCGGSVLPPVSHCLSLGFFFLNVQRLLSLVNLHGSRFLTAALLSGFSSS